MNDNYIQLRSNKCRSCKQNVADAIMCRGPPDGALEEEAALTDDRLQLGLIPEVDKDPQHRITWFDVFDKEGHLCPFDDGLIESDQLIYFNGYIKPIYDDDPSPDNGVPAQELGPINEWWISGFDEGDSFIIAFTTPYASYILMEPSPDYKSFMRVPRQKALLTKIVVEFLSGSYEPVYEELLSRIQEVTAPDGVEPLDENSMPQHAQFLTDQVCEIDDDGHLISTPAMQAIIDLHGTTVRKMKRKRQQPNIKLSKVTMTPLVSSVFELFFNNNEPYFSYDKTPEKKDLIVPDLKHSKSCFWEEGSSVAYVDGEAISVGDFVFISTRDVIKRNRIFRVEYFSLRNFTKQVHCSELCRGIDTILGESSHPKEFFFVDECSDWPISKIIGKTIVEVVNVPKNWWDFIVYEPKFKDCFFATKKYLLSSGRFEDMEEEECCWVCLRKDKEKKRETPELLDPKPDGTFGVVRWRGEEYAPGCCVFIEPFAVTFNLDKTCHSIEKTVMTIRADEVVYPEMYRKAKEVSLNEECPEPFRIGYVDKIKYNKKTVVTVRKLYRPENAKRQDVRDVRLLFWSDEEVDVDLEHVRGKCDVIRSKSPPDDDRFYFDETFDSETGTFETAKEVLLLPSNANTAPKAMLRTLNPFCGCGGLAEGLRHSGAVDLRWAIEIEEAPAKAFKLNQQNVAMYVTDCNIFLRNVLSGKMSDNSGTLYPLKGDVEFIIGGPPCQGFSSMNRFSAKQHSQMKNSLIVNLLSFCEFYRPKYFLMENVRNFVSFKKSIHLKHTLGCLVAMGYQCSMAVLQAGNFGLAQSRRRLFIVASAPGFPLPEFPHPSHVFFGPSRIDVGVDGKRYVSAASQSAPFRMMMIRDVIGDLTERDDPDHVSKEVSPLNEARIRHVPASKGCDWRDLPNVRVRLRDGTLTELLRYGYHDRKNGKSRSGRLRGVCPCAAGGACDPKERQNNTLIPWCLPHTANRNNNWTGLYGRLDWDGVFSTTVTNPEPSSKQGRVLHPAEHRIISVRECARSQGMHDTFHLSGTVMERYRQVGNAVPPPLARALGLQVNASAHAQSSCIPRESS